jgi:hypothetical protein
MCLAKLTASLLDRQNARLFRFGAELGGGTWGHKESPTWLNKKAQQYATPTSISGRKNKRDRALLLGKNISSKKTRPA